MTGHESIRIIEADKQQDVGLRYGQAAILAPLKVEHDSESSGISRIFAAIEDCETDFILVNLPAVASDHTKAFMEMIAAVAEEMDAIISVIFVADTQNHSVDFFNASQKSGLLSIATEKAVVMNGAFGAAPEVFPIAKVLPKGLPAFFMPKLDAEKLGKLKVEAKVPYLETIAGWKMMDRTVVKFWLKAADPLREHIVGNDSK
jgi:hypothetical protein